MKTNFLKSVLVLLTLTLYLLPSSAQSPEKMSYQAVIRDAGNNLITNTQVGIQISILQGSESGTPVYVETQTPTTNNNGLVSIEIGAGTVQSGDFTTIDWASGSYFIKTETALEAPLTTYTITGTSQLLSVPYALHAKTAETVTGTITETDPSVPSGTQPGEMQYWDGSEWVVVPQGSYNQTLHYCLGVPTWGPCYNEVENPTTGKIWMDRNLGASQVATSEIDPNAYGDLYQWGRGTDGHQIRTSGITSTLSSSDTPGHGDFITSVSSPNDWRNPQNDNLWQGVNGVNNPCPEGYRIPTEAEWEAERTSWSHNYSYGAFTSPLKLTLAGTRNHNDGMLDNVGSFGMGAYWSSTIMGADSRYLFFNNSSAGIMRIARGNGFSVRCIKD